MKKSSIEFISFLQATVLTIYCSLVSYVMWKGETWFDSIPNYFTITLMVIIFAVSALTCSYIVLGQAVKIFFEERNAKKVLKLIGYTAGWELFYILLITFSLALIK